MSAERPTRKEKRVERQKQARQSKGQGQPKERMNFNLQRVDPKTKNQKLAFDAYNNNKHLMLHGIAGTGKSYISMYLALNEIMNGSEDYKKLYIVRSVVPTRDMGFLPGSNKDKTKVYEAPYYAISSELFNRGDAYDNLKNKGIIDFISTSFIRGITLNDCIILVDEMQNMDWGELSSIITRCGKNCRIIYSGDFRQSDFRYKEKESKNDINTFMSVLRLMNHDFEFVEFGAEDIVRSELVKNFIIAVDKKGLNL